MVEQLERMYIQGMGQVNSHCLELLESAIQLGKILPSHDVNVV